MELKMSLKFVQMLGDTDRPYTISELNKGDALALTFLIWEI